MNEDERPQSLRELVNTLREMGNSDEAESLMRRRSFASRFFAGRVQAPSAYSATMLNLARAVDAQFRVDAAWRGEFDAPVLLPVIVGGGLVSAPAGMRGEASVAEAGSLTVRTHVEASAEVKSPAAETHDIDYQFWGALLLCVIAWLVFFVGPHLIAEKPSADQTALNDYWSIVPSIAVSLTIYVGASILAKNKRK